MKKQLLFVVSIVLTATFYAQNIPSYVPTNGLVGWWPFNGNANDESGNGLNGTISGPVLTTDRMNIPNSCYSFDVSNWTWGSGGDIIYIPFNSKMNSSNITVSIWFNRNTNGTMNQGMTLINRFQYGYNNPNGQTWGTLIDQNSSFNMLTGVNQASTNNNQLTILNNGPSISINQWYHLIFTFDGTNLKQFINGIITDTDQKEGFTLNTSGNSGISIGVSDQANGRWSPFGGKIDDISIYNRALTQEEITALYLGDCTKPQATITPKSTTNIKENESVVLAATQGNGYSYEWHKDGVAIANATDSNYTATLPGNYTVKISTSATCDSTSTAVTVKRVYALPNYLPTNGLVGWWPFNGNANDESGNENHGTVNGATLTSDRNGAGNKAYNFDGNSNSIQIPDGPLLNNNYVSVSAWFQTNSNVASSIIYKTNNSAMNEQYACVLNYPSSNVLNWSVKNGGNCNKPGVGWRAISPSKTVSDGIWHNIVTTYDGKISQLYIDGILILSNTFNTSIIDNCGGVINIGKGYNSNYLFNGLLDDIAIYNRALTQEEITALYNSCTTPTALITPKSTTNIKENESVVLAATKGNGYTYAWYKDGVAIANATDSNYTATTPGSYTVKISTSATCDSTSAAVTVKRVYALPNYLPTNGLVGWWPFNGNANDESGNENHGTVNGATLTSDKKGEVNKAYSFNGTTNYISFPSGTQTNLNILNDFTVSYWIKTDKSQATLLNFGDNVNSPYPGYFSGINGGNVGSGKLGVSTNGKWYSSNSSVNNNQWRFVSYVLNSTNLSIYIDGKLENTILNVSPPISWSGNRILGSRSDLYLDNYNYFGSADDIAIFNRALTLEEITALYLGECNAFSAKITPQGPTTVCQGTPVVLNANSGADFTYIWKRNNTIITSATGASYSATTSGSYEVEITTSYGCKKSSAKTLVTMNPLPFAGSIAGKNYVCKGESIPLVASIPGGVWSSLKPNLASVDQNGNVTGLMRTARFTTEVVGYTLTNQLGCSATAKRGIGIDSLPVQPIIAGPNAICTEGTALFRVTNTAGVNWTAGPFITASSAYQGMFTHRRSSNGSVPNDNFETFVKATAYSLNKVCTSVTTRAVKLRLARSKSIVMSAPSSLVVNATTPVSVSFQSGLTVTPSSRFWISSATTDLTVVQTTATSTTVKALRIPTALPKLYYNAVETSTGCGMSAYKQFTVMAAASLVAANTTQTVSTNGVHIYPNPSNGKFTIENSEEATEIKLVDITGRIIATHEITAGTTAVDFSGVTAGKYMIHITGESINEIQPIVIE